MDWDDKNKQNLPRIGMEDQSVSTTAKTQIWCLYWESFVLGKYNQISVRKIETDKWPMHLEMGFSYLPHNSEFKRPLESSLLKTLVTSDFSFSHNVFYSFQNRFQFFSDIYFVVCKCFQLGPIKIQESVDEGQPARVEWTCWHGLKFFALCKFSSSQKTFLPPGQVDC